MADEPAVEYSDPRNAARVTLMAALNEYAAATGTDGVITGYVVLGEVSLGGGYASAFWVTGNGATPSEDDWEGLNTHRMEGLIHWGLRHMLRAVDAAEDD